GGAWVVPLLLQRVELPVVARVGSQRAAGLRACLTRRLAGSGGSLRANGPRAHPVISPRVQSGARTPGALPDPESKRRRLPGTDRDVVRVSGTNARGLHAVHSSPTTSSRAPGM